MQPSSPRPILALLILLTLPILIGAALAPFAFNFLQDVSETHGPIHRLTDARFERVTNRVVMIVTAILLYPVIKMTGLAPRVRAGLIRDAERLRSFFRYFGLGCLSMAVLFGIGWMANAFTISDKPDGLSDIAGHIAVFLLGALIIGVLEEIFFRGFIFGALRTHFMFPVAAALSSVFFSAIHFFRPLPPEVVTRATWSSGYELIPHMFAKFNMQNDIWFAITLFFMGMTFATLYERRGNLYAIMGLHAGWVLAMRTGSFFFDRQTHIAPTLFGTSDTMAKGVLALVVILMFYAASLTQKDQTTNSIS